MENRRRNKYASLTDEEFNKINPKEIKDKKDKHAFYLEKECREYDKLPAEEKRRIDAERWKTL